MLPIGLGGLEGGNGSSKSELSLKSGMKRGKKGEGMDPIPISGKRIDFSYFPTKTVNTPPPYPHNSKHKNKNLVLRI